MLNDATSINQAQTEPTLAAKLRSWKWWVYGEMHPLPLEKTPWHCYAILAIDLLLWLAFFLHPWATTWINRTPPDFSALQTVHGKVIDTSSRAPHLWLKADNGSQLRMMFPTFLVDLQRPLGGTKSLGPANASVMGCQATVWFDKPRYTLFENYRIWQIRCDDGSEGASYDEIVAEAGLTQWLAWTAMIGFLLAPLLVFVQLARIKQVLLKK